MSTRAPEHQSTRKKSVIREWVESIIVAFVLAMFIRIFFVEPYKIPTGSMRPTLREGDIILVNKFLYGAKIPFTSLRLPGLRKPKRGDVVVFIYPQDRKKNFIKRLVAMEGETVEIRNGTVYINDKPLLESTFNQRYYYNRGEFAQAGQGFTVPKDSFFVLGDNSSSSQDSRYWGIVPSKDMVGKAMLIYWPPQHIRIIR